MGRERPDIWLPLNVGDYLRDTMHLTCAQHGAYLMLIMHYWMKGQPLPDDDRILAAVTKNSLQVWRKISPTLRDFFHVENGFWHHKRIDRDMAEAAELKRKNRERTAAATAARRAVTNNVTDNVTIDGTCTPLPAPPPKDKNKAPTRTPREGFEGNGLAGPEHPMPPDWQTTDADVQYAQAQGHDPPTVARIVRKMRDLSKTGALRRDWHATFRWFCEKEAERKPMKPIAKALR